MARPVKRAPPTTIRQTPLVLGAPDPVRWGADLARRALWEKTEAELEVLAASGKSEDELKAMEPLIYLANMVAADRQAMGEVSGRQFFINRRAAEFLRCVEVGQNHEVLRWWEERRGQSGLHKAAPQTRQDFTAVVAVAAIELAESYFARGLNRKVQALEEVVGVANESKGYVDLKGRPVTIDADMVVEWQKKLSTADRVAARERGQAMTPEQVIARTDMLATAASRSAAATAKRLREKAERSGVGCTKGGVDT